MRTTIKEELQINCPPKTLWKFIGTGFGDCHLYSRRIKSSKAYSPPRLKWAPSDKREVVFIPNHVYIDRLTSYNPKDFRFGFLTISGFPFPYRQVAVSVELSNISENQSLLKWQVEICLGFWSGWLVRRTYKRAIQNHYRLLFLDVKYFIENKGKKRPTTVKDHNFSLLLETHQ